MKTKIKHIIFDWGDTLMHDDPTQDIPMCQWGVVKEVEGARDTLENLSRFYELSVATNAEQSDERMVMKALSRVAIDRHIQNVFTSKSIGMKKNEGRFWISVLNHLGVKKEEVLVVGDNLHSDVEVPASMGIRALWYNSNSDEKKEGMGYSTIHQLSEVLIKVKQVGAGNF